jgi:hypothetical protein
MNPCAIVGNVVDVNVRTVRSSKTAVVAGPMDRSRFMSCYDAAYAWLRGQSAVTQVGQNIALYGHRWVCKWEIYGDPDEHDHVDVEICYLLS